MTENQENPLAKSKCNDCKHCIKLKAGGKTIYRCTVIRDISKLMHIMQHCPCYNNQGC